MTCRFVQGGDYFGERALLGDGRRTATVTAASEVTCFFIDQVTKRPRDGHVTVLRRPRNGNVTVLYRYCNEGLLPFPSCIAHTIAFTTSRPTADQGTPLPLHSRYFRYRTRSESNCSL